MKHLSEKSVFRVVVVALVLATFYRLYPLVSGDRVLSAAFMTEDGYLMLTVARNMAIGLGMSVSDGTIPSNGVQPIATFLFAVPYWLTDGDKISGLWGVQLIGAAISVIGVFTVRAFAREALMPQDKSHIWPWLVAALWYSGQHVLLHTMNGLETGLYAVSVTTTLVIFTRLLAKGEDAKFSDRMLLGTAGGITFLVRVDAIFLLLVIAIVWILHEIFVARKRGGRIAQEAAAPMLLAALIAAPWLINNYVNFGSIIPVSGTAQALSGGFAKNADLVPAVIFEYFFPMLPIPHALQFNPIFQTLASAIVVLIGGTFFIQVWRRGRAVRYAILAYLIFAFVMVAYYGFYFGAGWFLSRYLSPLAPLFIVATLSVALSLLTRVNPVHGKAIVRGLGVASLVLCFGLLGRLLIPGVKEQGHFQVVDWVTENVPKDVWAGAIQTGTLGYWHDRTINLDGKVNPDALDAILTEGNVLNYVLNSQIEYLADWHGIAAWTTTNNRGNDAFSNGFEVLVQDPVRNLDVLKRKN
ncbi:hypothetical protein SAMN05444273_11042 [Litoreibacter ascidiaceicola]|uniref:Dolichyl-phosphate-mannose-protein mannosyltransferase n=1 Tax=Litoreibacter ascidiaceicola TaxID=1486859 RepID=A0A1M5DV25_9RHOB|nr:hypothetical protein [Litoreibacter ascidiaceicola]SHF70898.1 hypothetical protein SAMN05444273_11042 [Litoreibacter ascidiaceicola]